MIPLIISRPVISNNAGRETTMADVDRCFHFEGGSAECRPIQNIPIFEDKPTKINNKTEKSTYYV